MRLFILSMSIVYSLVSIQLYAQSIKEQSLHIKLKNQGIERECYFYRPKDLPTQSPLVIILHGYGGNAQSQTSKFIDLADKEGFAVCYPQGAKDRNNQNCWNVGYPFQSDYMINDLQFIRDLVTYLQKEYHLSEKNIFLTGMSNGGEMCYLFAMESPQTFQAIASIAGLTLTEMKRVYSHPIPFMEVHGTNDKISLWKGDPTNAGGWGSYLSVPVAISYLVATNKCTHEVTEHLPRLRNEVILHKFMGGLPAWEGGPEVEVWLYEVIQGDHSWATIDMDTETEVWNFFKKYIK